VTLSIHSQRGLDIVFIYSRCSRATSACVKSQVTNTPGLMIRPHSAAISVDLVNRPFSAVDGNSRITMTTNTRPNRPHTTLAYVKPQRDLAQPRAAVADSSDDSETHSDYANDGNESDEDVEMTLGISEVAHDDYIRDVVFRLTQQKQHVQECRRNVVDTILRVRPPSAKELSRRRRPAPRTTLLQDKEMTAFDKDTSDEALRQLEDKLHRFYNDRDAGLSAGTVDERRKQYVVKEMKRFTVQVGLFVITAMHTS